MPVPSRKIVHIARTLGLSAGFRPKPFRFHAMECCLLVSVEKERLFSSAYLELPVSKESTIFSL
jgi:hypothetical protein